MIKNRPDIKARVFIFPDKALKAFIEKPNAKKLQSPIIIRAMQPLSLLGFPKRKQQARKLSKVKPKKTRK